MTRIKRPTISIDKNDSSGKLEKEVCDLYQIIKLSFSVFSARSNNIFNDFGSSPNSAQPIYPFSRPPVSISPRKTLMP